MSQLSEKTVVEVQLGKYGPYLAVGRKVAERNSLRWIYLSKTAMKAIDVQKIDKWVNSAEEGKIQLCGNQHVVVSQFRGCTYIGFHRLDMHGEIIRGLGLNLNRAEWQELVLQVSL